MLQTCQRLLVWAGKCAMLTLACVLVMAPLSMAQEAQPSQPQKQENGDRSGNGNGDSKENGNDEQLKPMFPETLFDWSIGRPQPEQDEGQDNKIVTDRPDFTESSKSVGRGRIQLEVGYTYTLDRQIGTSLDSHSFPEVLLRIGFTNWLELRISQNLLDERMFADGAASRLNGASDLIVGLRTDMTEQKGWLPETSIIWEIALPTGTDGLTTGEVLPSVNLCYSWDVIEFISLSANTKAFRDQDDSGASFMTISQSLSIGYTLTDKIGAFTEYFGLYPVGARTALPENYFDGGFTYLVTDNFQLDIRAGLGLNNNADDFFTGAGFAYRY